MNLHNNIENAVVKYFPAFMEQLRMNIAIKL